MNALQASDYTMWIMLTISLSVKVLRITISRKDEAAGNNGLPLGTNGLRVRREDNSSNSFLMTEYPSQLILQKISFTHH